MRRPPRQRLPGPSWLLLSWLLPCLACVPTEQDAPPGERLEARTQEIVGGSPAPGDEAVVALLARRTRCEGESLTLLCTGALVAPDVVLTAAHCLEAFGEEGAYEVFFGERLLPEPGPGRFVRVARAVRHPGYARGSHDWDAALLRLAQPVEVPPLRLPEAGWGALEAGQEVRAVGFGDTHEAGVGPGWRRQGALGVTEVEAGAFRAGPGPAMSCVGDSGGPVLARGGDGSEVVVGVTASGDVACRTEAFNVRVEALLEDFVKPFLPEVPAPRPGRMLTLEALCREGCAGNAECPSGLRCQVLEEGKPGRCVQPALQEGAYGATCTRDAQCGAGGRCARLEPEGEGACRCFTPCALEEETGGCTGTGGGPGVWGLLAVAGGLARRRRR